MSPQEAVSSISEEAASSSIHRMLSKDVSAGVGVCQACGPVQLKPKRYNSGKTGWVCAVATRINHSKGGHTGRRIKYRVSQQRFREMLKEQGGRCAICRVDISEKSVKVDHSHVTRAVRGLLCQRCNLGIGFFKDDVEMVRSALAYLEKALDEEAASVVVSTDYGQLKLSARLYAVWERKGWPEDHVLAEMVADGRWRP